MEETRDSHQRLKSDEGLLVRKTRVSQCRVGLQMWGWKRTGRRNIHHADRETGPYRENNQSDGINQLWSCLTGANVSNLFLYYIIAALPSLDLLCVLF